MLPVAVSYWGEFERPGELSRLPDEGCTVAFVNDFRSKRCRVDLSDVTASKLLDGDIAMENTMAGSTPRRSSASLAQFDVDHTLTSVP